MKKIIITTTKITHIYIPPFGQEVMDEIQKQTKILDQLIAKRKRMITRWKQQKGGKII
jgi:hypothetical protein